MRKKNYFQNNFHTGDIFKTWCPQNLKKIKKSLGSLTQRHYTVNIKLIKILSFTE